MSALDSPIRLRAQVLHLTRSWFHQRGYLEVQTPAIVPSPALEANLVAFPVNGQFLRTSPEFALKKLAAKQHGRIYEIGPCFRAEEMGAWHRPEFTMLEWYRAGADLWSLMDEVEAFIATLCKGLDIPEPRNWTRVSVSELFKEHADIDLETAEIQDLSQTDNTWEHGFYRRWIEDIEPALTHPTFVHSWPAPQAALAQVRTDHAWPVAQRFEVYLNGIELGNAFLELIDPNEQRNRFTEEQRKQTEQNVPHHPVDAALCEAVGSMPPTSGIAIGFDRLIALLSGSDGLHDFAG